MPSGRHLGLLGQLICLLVAAVVVPLSHANTATEQASDVGALEEKPAPEPPQPVVPSSPLRYWLARWFGKEPWARMSAEDSVPEEVPAVARSYAAEPRVTWIGQATVLVQHKRVNVLTDPIFAAVAGPLGVVGAKRISGPAVPLTQLPAIDAVVISHDHYDHLDLRAVRYLGNTPVYFVPRGVGGLLRRVGVQPGRIVELDWWQAGSARARDGTTVDAVALPARHVSGRGLIDRNRRQTGTWRIAIDGMSFYFAGDTGFDESLFRTIGADYGPFDLAFIPIGSYAPRSVMHSVHIDPREAVRVHELVNARCSLAIHWGTYFLTAEHPLEPPARLAEALNEAGVQQTHFAALPVGATRVLRQEPEATGCFGDTPEGAPG